MSYEVFLPSDAKWKNFTIILILTISSDCGPVPGPKSRKAKLLQSNNLVLVLEQTNLMKPVRNLGLTGSHNYTINFIHFNPWMGTSFPLSSNKFLSDSTNNECWMNLIHIVKFVCPKCQTWDIEQFNLSGSNTLVNTCSREQSKSKNRVKIISLETLQS